jgi:outer membrane protein assembly factor BamB
MAKPDNLFIGIRGYVLAIDRATGKDMWSTSLKGADFVNVVLDNGQLFAASKGRLYRLDPATGEILWENGLTGMGWGLVSIAQSGDGNWSLIQEKRRREQEAAAASTTTTS